MKLAYLVNQYPKVSHSFVRRELQALENLGMEVTRYTIRKVPLESLFDAQDKEEHNKTTALLTFGVTGFLSAMIRVVSSHPLVCIQAAAVATTLGFKSKRGVLRHLVYFGEACVLKEQLKKENIDHVHAHFGTNSTTVALLCRLLGGPSYSFTVHGPEEFDDPLGLALCEKTQHCKFVVTISDFGRGQLMRWCPHELWEKIVVVHCGVDASFLQVVELPVSDAPRLVCVGRLCAQKGQILLLEALSVLAREGVDFELVLAGDGEMRNAVETKIKEYGLEQKVQITGWISGDRVKEEILASRALVLPSFAEGLPVVIMEAFALQRPVVSTYIAGIPELVVHKRNGWLVPAGSAQCLTVALRDVLNAPPELLVQMGAEGVRAVRDRHDVIKEAQKIAHHFQAVSR